MSFGNDKTPKRTGFRFDYIAVFDLAFLNHKWILLGKAVALSMALVPFVPKMQWTM